MVKAMQSEKSVIPCPCKKDCADRCDGCKLECKKFGIYEKLKRYEEVKNKNKLIHKEIQRKENSVYVDRKEMYAEWTIGLRHNRRVMFDMK